MKVGYGEVETDKLKSLEIFNGISDYGNHNYNDKLMDFINILEKFKNEAYQRKLMNVFSEIRDIGFSMRNSFYHNECTFMPVSPGEEVDRNNIIFERVYLIWEQELNGIMRYDHTDKVWDIKSVGRFDKEHDIESRKITIGFDDNEDIKHIQYSNKAEKDGIEQIRLSKDTPGRYSLMIWNNNKKPSEIKFNIDETKLISTKTKNDEHIDFLVSIMSRSKRHDDSRSL